MAVQVANQPPPLRDYNVVAANAPLLEALRREGAAWAEDDLLAFGAELGGEPLEWGRLANQHPPVLHGHDRVEFHPAWHSLLALGIREGLQRPGSHVARAAKFMALAQVEAGVGCPLSMTHAAVPTLRLEPALAAEWEPRVTAGEALIGMAMTEKQGGSDVRANETEARPAGDREATLHGHKWFCSAPMSDAFLILAQAPGGLSCYLVPRADNGIVIERLKDKLGNRSNASSEIRLDGAWGRLVGDEGRGIATIIEMVVHTRLDCVLGSAALMREAVAQAIHHCTHRVAFGKLLAEQPLMLNVLADLCVESEAATIGALRLARAFDEGDEFRRVATAVLKYWVCKRAPGVVGEALECLGGNGFVEDSGLPRLYRESPLNAIWEGSSNVQCLDVLRAVRREPASAAAFLAELDERDRAPVERALAEADEHGARRLVETMGVALQATLLDRHSDPAIAASFRSRERFGAFGTLPAGLPLAAIVERNRPS
ncbi:MAG: acyl-CoA dehydrogenase [Actinomycetia bacterium]|nr:acyl-CoA dehydrogenase [Actinomycetes bacterium]